jgi:nicotinamidase-related amidase
MSKYANAALLVIDVQKAIDAPYHASLGPRNNPDAEGKIALLLAHWRKYGRRIVHVRHDSTFPDRPGQSGYEFKPQVAPLDGEIIVAKNTNSAFVGTELEKRLQAWEIQSLVVTGVSTNNSVEATVRMAGNLGFDTYLVEDACFTFAKRDFRRVLRTADEVHAMSLANLDGEYCSIVGTADVLSR